MSTLIHSKDINNYPVEIGDFVTRVENLGMFNGSPGVSYEVIGFDVGYSEIKLKGLPGSWMTRYFKAQPPAASKPTPMVLSTDAAVRKGTPITSGVLDYFPRALAAVAQCSKAGNDQHNPGQPLHWDKAKSTDHADCITRHLIDRHTVDTDGIPHVAKLAWRALALLETTLIEEEKNAV